MFRIFKTHIENALESLGANKMRTFLTMLGVIIGISSITAIFALSGGVGALISKQVSHEGAMVVVRPKEVGSSEKTLISSLTSSQNFVKSSLTDKDIDSISKNKKIIATAPLATFSATINAENKDRSSQILATTSELDKVINLKMRDGDFLANSSTSKNVVVGYQLAVNLFGTPDILGRNIKIKNETFTIIGVLAERDTTINFSNVDFNNSAIIDYSVAKEFAEGTLQIQQINARADSVNNLRAVDEEITKNIGQNHAGEADFEVLSGEEIAQTSSALIQAAGVVLALVAGISLLVGGIGIMNIMLVNVSERTREIGIRKALGANNLHILLQFLTESMIISLGGGLFGFILGFAFSFGVSLILPFQPVISWQVCALIGLISVFVGAIFGAYPALRASRKDPIESLRQYN
ncbi:MAG: ABC transporter permease [bacterium]|nr:ABC transporter permease [bacterium]